MNYDKRTVIDGLKRTIEQNEEKIIEYSKPCDARKRRIRALERDLLKKKNKELRRKAATSQARFTTSGERPGGLFLGNGRRWYDVYGSDGMHLR